MRRSVEFCRSMAKLWDQRQGLRSGLPTHIQEGINAYAIEHAEIERSRATNWSTKWMTLRERAQAVLVKSLGEVEEDVDLSRIMVPELDILDIDVD
jgi:hypothetical protein